MLSDHAGVGTVARDGDDFAQPGSPCRDEGIERQSFRIVVEGEWVSLRSCLESCEIPGLVLFCEGFIAKLAAPRRPHQRVHEVGALRRPVLGFTELVKDRAIAKQTGVVNALVPERRPRVLPRRGPAGGSGSVVCSHRIVRE